MTIRPSHSVNRGRLLLVLAAMLWSLGGLFTRLLRRDTFLGLSDPELSPLQIAFFRGVFAGLIFVPMLRRRDLTYRPLMPLMVGLFAAMNALFLSAMVLGPAANAILLQNTSPFWVYLACVYLLGEPADRRSWNAIRVGMIGVLIIIAAGAVRDHESGNLNSDTALIAAMGLASGFVYAGVVLCLRNLREHSSLWLTTQNQLGSSLCLGSAVAVIHGPVLFWEWLTMPTLNQLAFLAVFGVLQMGLPYLLFTHGLRSVSPYEAGTITLLEPILNPVWAYLVSPETDTPPVSTWLGGGLILGALAWRYLPRIGSNSSERGFSASGGRQAHPFQGGNKED